MNEVIQPVLKNLEKRLKDSLDALGREMAKIRAGRANPAILDDVRVEAYGQTMPLQQVGQVTAPDARTIRISPYDPSTLPAVEKAIQKSDLGLTPSNDGKVIHLTLPAMTEERRRDYVKMAKQAAEEAKISQRAARHDALDAIKKLEKDKELSQDDQKKAAEQVQKLIDEYGKKVDATLKHKEEEILEV